MKAAILLIFPISLGLVIKKTFYGFNLRMSMKGKHFFKIRLGPTRVKHPQVLNSSVGSCSYTQTLGKA
jgi:hypothetical protein